MSGTAVALRSLRIGVVGLILVLGIASPSFAQGYISPLIGFDFGGDSGCPEITSCEDRNLNLGVSVGALGGFLGTELEFAYAKDFFGEIPGLSSNVLTLMGNVMLAPRFGPAQPYALIGLGLIKTHADVNATDLLDTDNNHFGGHGRRLDGVLRRPHRRARRDPVLSCFPGFRLLSSTSGMRRNLTSVALPRASSSGF